MVKRLELPEVYRVDKDGTEVITTPLGYPVSPPSIEFTVKLLEQIARDQLAVETLMNPGPRKPTRGTASES